MSKNTKREQWLRRNGIVTGLPDREVLNAGREYEDKKIGTNGNSQSDYSVLYETRMAAKGERD